MLDIREIREQADRIEARLKTRNTSIDLTEIRTLDEDRRRMIGEVEDLKSERNQGSQEVGRRKRDGEDASKLLETLSGLSERISAIDASLKATTERIDHLLSLLPNVPHESVPEGPKENKVVLRTFGERCEPGFDVKHHLLIGEEKGVLDFGRAARIAVGPDSRCMSARRHAWKWR